MATGSQAIAQLAAATGIMWSQINRAAVALRGAGMWPMGALGGGKTTPHVTPEHLINLMLAVACASPITAAPKVVHRYRSLMLGRRLDEGAARPVGDHLDDLLLSSLRVELSFLLDNEYPEALISIYDSTGNPSLRLATQSCVRRMASLTHRVDVPCAFVDVLRTILHGRISFNSADVTPPH